MAVLKKHHRAAHHGHYYECLVKFKGVAYNKVYLFALPRCTVGGLRCVKCQDGAYQGLWVIR